MIDTMNYEIARERFADYRRQAIKAEVANAAKARREKAGAMRFTGPREMVEKIVNRWGWQAAQPSHG